MPEFINLPTIVESAVRTCAAGPLFANMVSGGMLALGVAMLLAILLRRSGRYYGKLKRQAKKAGKPSAPQTRREGQMASMFDRASPLLDAPATVVRWQVEMQELARELKAEVDTKICLLQVLVRRSNEAAARLEAAAARAERLGCVERPDDEAANSILSLAEKAAASRKATASPPNSDQIYAMADSGNMAAEIADRIGLPLGDVEFVLSLRQGGANAER